MSNPAESLESLAVSLGQTDGSSSSSKTPSSKSAVKDSTKTSRTSASSGSGSSSSSSDDNENLPPLPEREPPGYFKYMPPLIQDLWNRGVEIAMEGKTGALLVEGFYKNGPMSLEEKNGVMVATDKRSRETVIASFEDLAKLNYKWWCMANSRSQNGQYVVPQRPWLDEFLKNKWASRKVIYIPNEAEGTLDMDGD